MVGNEIEYHRCWVFLGGGVLKLGAWKCGEEVGGAAGYAAVLPNSDDIEYRTEYGGDCCVIQINIVLPECKEIR